MKSNAEIGRTIKPDKEIELIDELSTLANQSASNVRLISTDSEEGMTLKQAFGGLAALLRWSWS